MTIKELLNKGVYELKEYNITSPILKSKLILQKVLNKPKEYLLIYDTQEVSEKTKQTYLELIEKVAKGMPVQYITRHQEFMKLDFYVDERVLIPRPDTEILVEEVIQLAEKMESCKILDLGTGSGAIAVSLAKYIENCYVYASDTKEEAIEVAIKNSEKNNISEDKIEFIESDLFHNMPNYKFDIIVSNPPYISTQEIKTLDKEVQSEPISALDGGKDGLNFYRSIIKEAAKHLYKSGYLCLEIGYDQKEKVEELLYENGEYTNIYTKQDMCGNDRVVVASKK